MFFLLQWYSFLEFVIYICVSVLVQNFMLIPQIKWFHMYIILAVCLLNFTVTDNINPEDQNYNSDYSTSCTFWTLNFQFICICSLEVTLNWIFLVLVFLELWQHRGWKYIQNKIKFGLFTKGYLSKPLPNMTLQETPSQIYSLRFKIRFSI